MSNNINDWPQISGSIKFSPYAGFETSASANRLSPKLMITIGLLLAGYGLYLVLNQAKEEVKENN